MRKEKREREKAEKAAAKAEELANLPKTDASKFSGQVVGYVPLDRSLTSQQ